MTKPYGRIAPSIYIRARSSTTFLGGSYEKNIFTGNVSLDVGFKRLHSFIISFKLLHNDG